MNPRGPVSDRLHDEVKKVLQTKGLVIWLDPARAYEGFAATLGPEVGTVVRHQGSFTRMLTELAPFGGELDAFSPGPVLIYLPGLDEAAVARTPLLELAATGTRWQQDLQTLVAGAGAGRVAPEALKSFVAGVQSLEEADGWLDERLADAKGGLGARYRTTGLREIVNQLLPGGALRERVSHPGEQAELLALLHRRTGLPEAFWRTLVPQGDLRAHDIATALSGWALCVEYLHDPVPRTPKTALLQAGVGLPQAAVDECRVLARELREHGAGSGADQHDFYARTANEVEEWIAAERAVDPDTLGHIDTFHFEENVLLRSAVAQLVRAEVEPGWWDRILALAEGRAQRSYWLKRDERRKMAWRLVLDGARLGKALSLATEVPRWLELGDAVAWYKDRGSAVDRAHRILEQDTLKLLRSDLPEFEALRTGIDEMRKAWSIWAGNRAREFASLCQKEGHLPPPALQQRRLFEDVVMRDLDEGLTAYFLVDALRYEMAEALQSTLEGAKSQLGARLAELPTLTAVGMNVLAPVVTDGKLRPVVKGSQFGGFQLGEYRVTDRATRTKAIHGRAGGGTCPWLELHDVLHSDGASLKLRVRGAKVVIVHSEELDQAGESGVGLPAFEVILQQLREAWVRLRDAGVRRFVITADHGFLLLDRDGPTLDHGTVRDPQRRHVVRADGGRHPGEQQVALSSLGYEGASGFLMMPDGIQVFRTTQTGQVFVHGGNSLQERVIPVLVVTTDGLRLPEPGRYVVVATGLPDAAGMHRLAVTVQAGGRLPFVNQVDVVLRAIDAPGAIVEVWLGDKQTEGRHQVPFDQRTELFFRIRGGSAPRVAVQVSCSGELESDPVVVGHFSVEAPSVKREEAAAAPPRSTSPAPAGLGAPTVHDWLQKIEDPGHRQVLQHLYSHRSITEPEISRILGNAYLARKFGLALDKLVTGTAPFTVTVTVVGGVKRYQREDG